MLNFIAPLDLVMFESVNMPENKYNQEIKKWEKTGVEIEKTLYTFRDSFGKVLKLYGDNGFRQYENQKVQVHLSVSQKEFQGRYQTKLKLDSVEPLQGSSDL